MRSSVASVPRAVTQSPIQVRRDLAHTPSILWLWCAPAALAIVASVLSNNHVLSLTVAGALWTAATAWIGVGCIINARHCGRVHCAIDGVMYPLLSVVGVLNVLGIVTVNWNVYWTVFFAILGASFLAELVWRKYV